MWVTCLGHNSLIFWKRSLVASSALHFSQLSLMAGHSDHTCMKQIGLYNANAPWQRRLPHIAVAFRGHLSPLVLYELQQKGTLQHWIEIRLHLQPSAVPSIWC